MTQYKCMTSDLIMKFYTQYLIRVPFVTFAIMATTECSLLSNFTGSFRTNIYAFYNG